MPSPVLRTCDEHGNACLCGRSPQGAAPEARSSLLTTTRAGTPCSWAMARTRSIEKRLRHWDGAGGQHDELVDVGDRRADERVFPGQKRLQNALVALPGDTDEIADEGRLVLPPEAASGAALDNAVLRLYIIEAAQGFDDTILFHMLIQTGSAANHRSHRQDRHQPVRFPCL